MEWFVIEALCALLLGVVIVAWTMWPARRKPPAAARGERRSDGP
jgi:uncharacterized iron-regulated membrane protein